MDIEKFGGTRQSQAWTYEGERVRDRQTKKKTYVEKHVFSIKWYRNGRILPP